MNKLFRAECYKLHNSFYRNFYISYLAFYLLYPVFFWFFGRYHAEMAMRTYTGVDFLCSMPHYLEYAWIWLPILCSKYVSNDLTYCSYMSCFFSGFSRSKMISVKILFYYCMCIPLWILHTIVFPLVWSIIGKKGLGIGGESIHTYYYIRYFGNYITDIRSSESVLLLKVIIFSGLSFFLFASVVFVISIFSESRMLTTLLSFIIIVVPREGIGMIFQPSEKHTTFFHKVLYAGFTINIYTYSSTMTVVLCTIYILMTALLIVTSVLKIRHMDF